MDKTVSEIIEEVKKDKGRNKKRRRADKRN